MRNSTRSRLHRYSVAVFAVLLALLLTQLLWMLLKPTLYPLFLAAVMVSSWYGGIGPGLLATVLAAVTSKYFFVPPLYSLALSSYNIVGLVNFVLVALLISTLNAALRSANQQAEVALAKLRASEERYRRLIDTANEGIWTLDALGRINYVNSRVVQMLGYSVEEMLERSVFDFIDSVSHLEAQRQIERRQQGMTEQHDVQFRRQDGSVLWAIVSTSPILGKTGELVGTLAMITDVTDRKQAEEALQASQALFESFMIHSPVTAFIKDFAGRYIYVNHLLEHLFNRKLADWLGKTDFDIFPSQVAQQWRDNDLAVLTTGKTMQMLETAPHDDGEHYYMSFKFLIADVSGRQLLGGMAIDITELKRLEAERNQLLVLEQAARASAESANRSKDEFLAVLSHELRTPLTAILGWAGMLQAGKLDEARATLAIETIERNAGLQMQLIEDLLDISRIIRGEISLSFGLVDLVGAIAAAIGVVQPAADAKAIQLESVLDASVAEIWGDSDRLQQVVWNLLSNAIKFTPSGGRVEVRLSVVSGRFQQTPGGIAGGDVCATRATNYAQIQVRDTGKGISADFLPYVFERFCQADSKSTRSHKGLGLGMAIARHLVELHGGTIQAESPGIGLGATFTVKLPLHQGSRGAGGDREVGRELLPISPSPLTLQGLQVLVVDDDADTREWLITVLQECGAQVIALGSVEEVLETLEHLKPDVLLSDIGMSGEDGYALIRKVRELEPDRGGCIPAAALTAYASIGDYREALAAGFQLHVAKPIRAAELVAVVASLAKMSGKL